MSVGAGEDARREGNVFPRLRRTRAERGTAAHVCAGRAQRGERLRTFAEDVRREGNAFPRLRTTRAERNPPATDFSISRNAGTRSSANGNAGPFNNLRPYLIEYPACLFGRMMASRVPLCVGRGVIEVAKKSR